jgi:hypothetical protein
MSKLSKVFRDANKLVWDGGCTYTDAHENGFKMYICHSIEKVIQGALQTKAKTIILSRLGVNNNGECHTVVSYLREVLGISYEDTTDGFRVQKYRKDWLTALEQEFKEIENKFPKGVHHIDGNKNNWDMSNLVKLRKPNNFSGF